MKQFINIILATTYLTIFGLAQAQGSSELTDEPVKDHKQMLDKSMMESEGSDCKAEHDHRKFKGLPSGPCNEASDDEDQPTGDEKVEGHNHREQHK